MTIERTAPSTALRPLVEFLAQRRADGGRIALPIFPTARAEILFNFGDDFAIGPDRETCRPLPRAAILPPQRHLSWQRAGPAINWFLVALTPAGCRLLLGTPLAGLWGAGHPLAERWAGAGKIAARIEAEADFAGRVAIIEDLLGERRASGEANSVERAADLARITAIADVATLANDAGLGERQLRNRFDAEIGIAPKLYLRLMRFNRHLAAAHPRPWRRLGEASDAEYFDESHAHRDFREFTGSTPGRYRRSKREAGDPLVFTGPAEHA